MFETDKVKVVVIVENKNDLLKYFNLFRLLIDDKEIEKIYSNSIEKKIISKHFVIEFILKNESQRGKRAHYILNLTQDKDFHHNVALPMTCIKDYLKYDKKWSFLFGKE